MLKHLEVSLPDSCLNKAFDNEIIFVLLQRDRAAADTVRYWAKRRIELCLNSPDDPKIVEALLAADRMAHTN